MVTASLKDAAKNGIALIDPSGYIRNGYTPLVSYIADLPEQQLIACVTRNASPVTIAEMPQFGNPTPAAPQTREHTLYLIEKLCQSCDAWDLAAFLKAAKALKLLGVHLPFWRDWMFCDPLLFLTGEVLHTGHKFFFDHVLNWCKVVAGPNTLDSCFSSLHQRILFRHFSSGVSRPLQMTGRDHCDMERTIVPILDGAGTASDEFIHAVRALIEFIYRAQDPVHTDSSITAMEQALAEFHARKQSILDLRVQRGGKGPIGHFKIPKLELMMSFAQQTKANGPLIQYTADVPERLLITHCKTMFQHTSRNTRTYVDQVVEILNREETIQLFNLYAVLRQAESSALENLVHAKHNEVTVIDPTLQFIQHVVPEKESTFRGPHPFCNHFDNPKSFTSTPGNVALHVTVRPDHKALSMVAMQALYCLPDLSTLISCYVGDASRGNSIRWDSQGSLIAWNKFQIQTHSSFRSCFVNKSQVVQAHPPSNEYPLGYCDAVLLRRPGNVYGMFWATSTLLTHNSLVVAQVHAIFKLKATSLPEDITATPLCYVRLFHVLPLSAGRPSVGLHQVEHVDPLTGIATDIVPLTDVFHVLDLVPVFHTAFPNVEPNSKTCMEGYACYYLNTFADKETFHVLHLQSQY